MADILASIDGPSSSTERKRPVASSSSSSSSSQNHGFSHRPRASLRYGTGLSSGYMVRGGMAQKSSSSSVLASQQSPISPIKKEPSAGSNSILKGVESPKQRNQNRVSFSTEDHKDGDDDVNMDRQASAATSQQHHRQEQQTNQNNENDENDEYFDDTMMAAMDDYETRQKEQQQEKDIESLNVPKAEPKSSFTMVKEKRTDLQTWESAAAMVSDSIPADDSIEDAVRSMEPPRNMDALEEDGSLHMWWYDAYERRDKGYVYLFGKVCSII